jgi:transcriptional regulator with XRE-family HTH domain
MTKLKELLKDRNIKQQDLIKLIEDNTGFRFGRDRISRICTGKFKNYSIETAVMISEALNVPIDEIVELKNVKKLNKIEKA